jgi:prepilin signal peptidase PulO-like enzyme (type II secretory pathway)
MPLLYVVLIVLLIGVVVTLIYTKVPNEYLAPVFKNIILWGAVIGVIIWLITIFAPGLTGVRVGH